MTEREAKVGQEAYLSNNGLVELNADVVVLSVRGGGDLELVLGQVDCGRGVGKGNSDIDQVGPLGPENYIKSNKCEKIALVITVILESYLMCQHR